MDSPAHSVVVITGRGISGSDASALLKAKIKLAVNRIMATYLASLEQLADEHDEAMGKLMDVLPADHRASVHLADIYGEARFEAIRRGVLKAGNDEYRELEQMIEFLCQRGGEEGA